MPQPDARTNGEPGFLLDQTLKSDAELDRVDPRLCKARVTMQPAATADLATGFMVTCLTRPMGSTNRHAPNLKTASPRVGAGVHIRHGQI